MRAFVAPCVLLKLLMCQLFIISAGCLLFCIHAISKQPGPYREMSSATGEGEKPGEVPGVGKK